MLLEDFILISWRIFRSRGAGLVRLLNLFKVLILVVISLRIFLLCFGGLRIWRDGRLDRNMVLRAFSSLIFIIYACWR